MTALLEPAVEVPEWNRSPFTPQAWDPSWGPGPRWGTERSPDRKTYGPAVGKLAAALGKPLFPWQQYVVDVAHEVDDDGEYLFDEVIVFVQRRAGKTVLIEPIVTHRCGQPVKRAVWLTAQKRDNAVKRWRDATNVLMNSSLGRKLVRGKPLLHRIISNSKESLTWQATGSYFVPFAPDADTMHGEDPDDVIVDELWSFDLEQMRAIQGGYVPAWSVKRGREFKMSAAGNAGSAWMKLERARGRAAVEAGGRTRIAYFEWCVPETVGGVKTIDLDDELLLQVVLDNHPRRDHGLRVEYLRAQLDPEDGSPGMTRQAFLRAFGGIDEDESDVDTVIPKAAMQRAFTRDRIPDDARVALGFEVDPDRRESAVSASWRGPDGRALTQLVKVEPGTRWLGAYLLRHLEAQGDLIGAVVVNNAGPARDVADELLQAGVSEVKDGGKLLRLSQPDYAAACSRFGDAITDVPPGGSATVTHGGERELIDALTAANRRKLPAGGHAWGPGTGSPYTALVSHTLAVWGADHLPAVPEPKPRFRIY